MVSKIQGAIFAGLVAATMGVAPVQAATVNFSLSGQNEPTVTFQLDLNPTPDISAAHIFQFLNVPVLVNGVAATHTVSFYDDSFSGGMADESYYSFYSQQLFTGTTSNPTFLLLTVVAGNIVEPTNNYPVTYVASLVTAPLPAAWVLMLSTLSGLGWFARRRHAG